MITVAGTAAISFGTNSAHPRDLLKTACENQGWKNVVFRPPSKNGALERAVNEIARPIFDALDAPPLSVRRLAQDLAFEAVRIERGMDRNTARHILSAKVDENTDAVKLIACDASLDVGSTTLLLQASYDNQISNLSASQVRTVVASVVRKLQGVSLGAANLYYLPHDAVSKWQQWRDEAQLFKYHLVPFQVASDPATVEHIINQLNEEVSGQAQEIIGAISIGSLEPKSAKALAKRAQAIIDKIKSYESALGQQLDWMREPLEQAQAALSVSTLMAVSA